MNVRLLAMALLASCQSPLVTAHRDPLPDPPPPTATATAPPPEAPPIATADPSPPALTGDPTQTWHLNGFDVVASLPIGAREKRPVVVGIHGSHDRPEAACARWRQALAAWAFVVCPEGVPYRKGLAWGSPAGIAERADAAVAALRERYGAFVAEGPVVYAGWSLGATRGPSVVALRPGIFEPVVLVEAGHTRIDATASAKALRTGKSAHAIIACATKRCAAFAKRLATASHAGPTVTFVDAGIGRGHLFDDRMAHAIGAALANDVANDPRWSGLAAALAAPSDADAGAPLPADDDDENESE